MLRAILLWVRYLLHPEQDPANSRCQGCGRWGRLRTFLADEFEDNDRELCPSCHAGAVEAQVELRWFFRTKGGREPMNK